MLAEEASDNTQQQTATNDEISPESQIENLQDIIVEPSSDQITPTVENNFSSEDAIKTLTLNSAESVVTLSRLEFRFEEDCWVQVVDAKQAIIESSLRDANTSLVVTGEAPFSIILGNIVGTSLAFNGEPVALANASGGRTLRITVGS